jgi:hypothetical protein
VQYLLKNHALQRGITPIRSPYNWFYNWFVLLCVLYPIKYVDVLPQKNYPAQAAGKLSEKAAAGCGHDSCVLVWYWYGILLLICDIWYWCWYDIWYCASIILLSLVHTYGLVYVFCLGYICGAKKEKPTTCILIAGLTIECMVGTLVNHASLDNSWLDFDIDWVQLLQTTPNHWTR